MWPPYICAFPTVCPYYYPSPTCHAPACLPACLRFVNYTPARPLAHLRTDSTHKAILEGNRDILVNGASNAAMPSLVNIQMELRKCCNHPYLIKGVEESETHALSESEYCGALLKVRAHAHAHAHDMCPCRAHAVPVQMPCKYLHLPCTCHAPAMHLPCTCHAHTMHTPCTHHAHITTRCMHDPQASGKYVTCIA